MNNLIKLLFLCKYGVFLTVNEHRDYYRTVEQKLNELSTAENISEISNEIKQKMIETNTIIELQFYPNTPIGSYILLHYDIEKILEEAIELLKEVK